MEEINEQPNVEISSATVSLNTGWMGLESARCKEILNVDEIRAFCVAVTSGNVKEARSMLQQNTYLAQIKLPNGMLPIDFAAFCGHEQMLRVFMNEIAAHHDKPEVQLFFTTLQNSMFGVALDMLGTWPHLAKSRNEKGHTALHVLAQKQPEGLWEAILIDELWNLINGDKERNEMLELISKPSEVLLDAAKSGNLLILERVLESNPDWSSLMKKIDDDGNNILHLIGKVSPSKRFESSRPDILLQRELLSFKEVEKRVPPAFKSMKNKKGHTPKDIFYSTHGKLMVSAKNGMKDKANNGMLVATIIATIVFAASLTIPGQHDSPEPSSLILQKQPWFIVFFVSNSIALFSSSASTIFFLTVLTSSYTEDEFKSSLPLRLTSGVTSLFLAMTSMVVAFIAACFLIFSHHSTWVAYLVASLGFGTVALFVFLLHTLFGDLFGSLYWSKHFLHQTRRHFFYSISHYAKRLKLHELLLLRLLEPALNVLKLYQNSDPNKHVLEDKPAVDQHVQEDNLAVEP